MYSEGDSVHMVGMGGRAALFILEVAEGVLARYKRWKESVAGREIANVCSATGIREGCTDGQEISKEVEQGSEARLHKYRRGEKFDALLLGA